MWTQGLDYYLFYKNKIDHYEIKESYQLKAHKITRNIPILRNKIINNDYRNNWKSNIELYKEVISIFDARWANFQNLDFTSYFKVNLNVACFHETYPVRSINGYFNVFKISEKLATLYYLILMQFMAKFTPYFSKISTSLIAAALFSQIPTCLIPLSRFEYAYAYLYETSSFITAPAWVHLGDIPYWPL